MLKLHKTICFFNITGYNGITEYRDGGEGLKIGRQTGDWEHQKRLWLLCAPVLLLPAGRLLSFLPQGGGLLSGLSFWLLLVLLQSVETRGEWLFLSLLHFLCQCVSCRLMAAPLFQTTISALLLVLMSVLWAGRQQLSETERRSSNQESTLKGQLNERMRNLMSLRGMDAILQQLMRDVEDICGYPTAYFSVSGTEISRAEANPPGLILYDREMRNIHAAAASGKIVGVGTCYCIHSAFRCYPAVFSGRVCGVLAVLIGVQQLEATQTQFLDTLIGRGFIALERQQLVDTQADIMTKKQVEEARSSFLFAISHDFRTPLTAIIGACAELERADELSTDSQKLVMAIREESAWLSQMVENLLSITRMSTGELNLALNDEVLEEIVGEAASKCLARYPLLKLNVAVPEDVMILRVDATLIIQVILNLVENAVKYAAASQVVDLTVLQQGESAVISVRDYGNGISADELDELFHTKALRSGDTKLGLGIGLSICRTIVEAHGGEIWAENIPESGAVFRFSLPLEVLNV